MIQLTWRAFDLKDSRMLYCGEKILQCCPVFVPQIIGLPVFPPEVTEKASSLQSPTDPSLVLVISTLYGPAISNF